MTIESLNTAHRWPSVGTKADWMSRLCATVIVTTICDRQCPLCSYTDIVHTVSVRHFSVDSVLRDISCLHQVNNIRLMGGEITLHPDIERLLEEARKIRGKKLLSMTTNGARLLAIADSTAYLDAVYLSVYDNPAEMSHVASEYAKIKPKNVEFNVREPYHIAYAGRSYPCVALRDTIAVMNGEVYPCCGSVGIANAAHTSLTEGWEKRLLFTEAPCERCVAAN